MFPNNHSEYPQRISSIDKFYLMNLPFYESPILKKI